MKRFIVVMFITVGLMFAGCATLSEPAEALEMPAIEGSFKYLPVASVLTLGAGATIADFSKDDSETPLSLSTFPMKVLYSSSLKGSVAWSITGKGKGERNGLIPDYGGPETSIDIMKLLKNSGANINTDVALTIDTGLLIGISKLLDSPSKLDLQPSIGASLKIKF